MLASDRMLVSVYVLALLDPVQNVEGSVPRNRIGKLLRTDSLIEAKPEAAKSNFFGNEDELFWKRMLEGSTRSSYSSDTEALSPTQTPSVDATIDRGVTVTEVDQEEQGEKEENDQDEKEKEGTDQDEKSQTDEEVDSNGVIGTGDDLADVENETVNGGDQKVDAVKEQSTDQSTEIGTGDDVTLTDVEGKGISGDEEDDGCKETLNGFFGDVGRSTAVSISYVYRVETIAPVTENDMETNIIPSVEVALTNALVPALIENCKSTNRALKSNVNPVVGISPNPEDEVLDAESCKVSPAFDCKVVQGYLTLFTDGLPSQSTDDMAHNAIRSSMARGDLNDASKKIVGVTYVGKYLDSEDDDLVVFGEKYKPALEEGTNSVRVFPIAMGIMVGMLIVAIVAAFVLTRKKRREAAEEMWRRRVSVDDDTGYLGESEGNGFSMHIN